MNWFIPEWLLALALTLFLVDIIVFQGEVLTLLGIAFLSGWLVWRLDLASGWWCLAAFIISYLIFCVVYYLFFRATVAAFVRKVLCKNAPSDVLDQIVGAKGHVHFVDGIPFFRWKGEELLPIDVDKSTGVAEGNSVTVSAFENGDVTVS